MPTDLSYPHDPEEVGLNLTGPRRNRMELDLAGAGAAADGQPNAGALRRYLSALLRYKWLIIGVTITGTVLGLVASRFVSPTYVVQSTVWIDPGAGGGRGPIEDGQMLSPASWGELLKSYAVLDYVVNTQRLYLEYEPENRELFAGFGLKERFRPGDYRLTVSPDGRTYTLEMKGGAAVGRAPAGDSLGREVGFVWTPRARLVQPGRVVAFSVRPPRDAARDLSKEVNHRLQQKGGSFMQLELKGKDRRKLAATLNAVVDRFVDLAAELKRARLKESAGALTDQLHAAQRNLQAAEIALESFRVQTITLPTETGTAVAPGVTATQGPAMTNFMTLKLQQEQLRQDLAALQQTTAAAADSAISIAQLEAIPSVQAATELKTALAELATRRASKRALLFHYTEEHASVKRVQTEIETLEEETVPQLVTALMVELSRRGAQIQSQIDAASTELREVPPRMMEEARLRRAVAIADNLENMLQQRHEEARLAALSSVPDLRIVDRAAVPNRPIQDPRKQIMMLGFALSLGMAVGGVILFEQLDPRVRYPDQVTRGLRLPILAAVPRLKTRNGAALIDNENTSQVIEAFRGLRLKLLHDAGGDRLVTAITSPGSGDGKSFITMNLALAFADQGYRTLVIDGDIRRGALHRFVGAKRKPGLTDVLGGNATRADVVQQTSHHNLDLIACGTRLHTGPELLGSPALFDLIKELREVYAVILIDSPPLGAGVDPFVIGATVGNLAVVLRAGLTDREFAEAKLEVLDGLPVRILGAILNGVPSGGAYRYYSYLSGYEAGNEAAIVEDSARLPVVS